MNAEMGTDRLNTDRFLGCIGRCENQLCEARSDETQLNKAMDTFPRFQPAYTAKSHQNSKVYHRLCQGADVEFSPLQNRTSQNAEKHKACV